MRFGLMLVRLLGSRRFLILRRLGMELVCLLVSRYRVCRRRGRRLGVRLLLVMIMLRRVRLLKRVLCLILVLFCNLLFRRLASWCLSRRFVRMVRCRRCVVIRMCWCMIVFLIRIRSNGLVMVRMFNRRLFLGILIRLRFFVLVRLAFVTRRIWWWCISARRKWFLLVIRMVIARLLRCTMI